MIEKEAARQGQEALPPIEVNIMPSLPSNRVAQIYLRRLQCFCLDGSPIYSGGKNMKRTLTAVVHKEGDYYVADCPEVGTVSQGTTIEEAINNLREATELYLEEFPVEEAQHPLVTIFEVAVHA
jgi:predicted RNase H-like HicB family nuclease